MLPVVGLEEEIKALRAAKDQMLRLPNVSTVTAAGPGPRLNVLFYAFDETIPFIMIVAAAAARHQPRDRAEPSGSRPPHGGGGGRRQVEGAGARQRRLDGANTNLEQFAAIVTPRPQVADAGRGYLVDEIETAVGASDTETARGKLNELRRQSTRLSSMLSALLHYSSAGAQPAVDPDGRYPRAGDGDRALAAAPRDRDRHPRLLAHIGYAAAPLDLALRNLIDNTVKHHDRGTGILRLACSDAGSAIEITVEDDGPGIDPAHHAAVFLPFRTVSNGGDGMGLAIVQKMIDAAGGAITLSSNPAVRRGTTFRIRWPKQIAL